MTWKIILVRKHNQSAGTRNIAIAHVKPAMLVLMLVVLFLQTADAQTGPTISSLLVDGVVSNTGPVGATLTIQGTGFGASIGFSTATLNGIALAGAGVKPISWSATSIVVVIPTTASSGPVIVTVSGQASNSVSFAIGAVITQVSPTSGLAGTGVTISGQGFGTSGGTVTFNGVTAATTSWTSPSIVATVPTAATAGPIVVTVSGQASNGAAFTPTPSISGLSPNYVVPGTNVVVAGNSFGNQQLTSTVVFNGVSATVINNWSDTSITALVPSNVTAGSAVVTVNGVASSGFPFTLTFPYAFSESYAPNGNVLTASDNINGNWVYAYDNFNRLTCSNLSSNGSCAKPSSGTPTYSYAYDQYGNRWQQNGPYTVLLTFSNSQNHMDGYSYDAAGNLLNDGYHAYTYDAENRIIQVDQGQTAAYVYDGAGQRIQKASGGAVVAQYLHDLSGNTITELNSSGVWTRGEIYFSGRHLATYGNGSSGTTYFIQQDWLGTERARVLPTGDLFQTCVSLPFGDGQTCTGSPDPSPNHFTGNERDAESSLDYFGARHYASTMGRFMTPDPSGLLAQKPASPQSWNLYAYAMNNPLVFIDPTGLDCVYANNAGNGVESIDHDSNSGECGSNGGTWAPGYVDENWATFNQKTQMFQVGSVDGAGSNSTVDYTNFAAGAQTDANGNCTSGCGGYGFASANANWLQSQLVGNSMLGGLDGYIQFLTGRQTPLQGGLLMQLAAGPLDPSTDHWAGPGGMGPPGGRGDWAASVHDYNFSTNDIKVGSYFNPTLKLATSMALIKSNNTLMRNAGGIQSLKMGLFFGPANALQWYANSWK